MNGQLRDPLVGSSEGAGGGKVANTNIQVNGMPLMDAMKELSERCGKSCWTWKDSNSRQEKKIKERQPWSWIWRKPSNGQVSQWYGLGRLIAIFRE